MELTGLETDEMVLTSVETDEMYAIDFQRQESGGEDIVGLDVRVLLKDEEKENKRVIDSGNGVKIQLPCGAGMDDKIFKAEPWPTEERLNLRQKENLSEIYRFETDIYHVREQDSDLPFCASSIKEDDIDVEIELPLFNGVHERYVKFKAFVKNNNIWTLVDAILKNDRNVVFHINQLESVCILSCLRETNHAVLPTGCEYMSPADDSIIVSFPPNSVKNEEEIQFKVHPVDFGTKTQENDSFQVETQMFAISPRISAIHRDSLIFEKEIEIQLPIQFLPGTIMNEDEMECKILKWTDNTFTPTDIESDIRRNEIVIFKVQSFSGYSAVVLKKESLQRSMSSLSSLVDEVMGLKLWCKLLFFVFETSQRNLIILLECVEKGKVGYVIKQREQYGFRFVSEWISRDFLFSPETKILIDIKGKFSLPRRTPFKTYQMTFFPAAEDNFTRFVVEMNQRVGGDIYGIISFRDGNVLLDEIYYDPLSCKKVPPSQQIRKRLTDSVQKSPRINSLNTPRVVTSKGENIAKNPEKEFLTDKGLIAVTNLLSPDKISEAFIFMNMTKAQYDQICERNPPGVMRNLSLFRYALEHDSKSSKLDVLVTALTDVGEKALAEKIQHLFKNGIDLNDIRD